ncbi:MAG: hypothetical protein J6M12_03385 [Clostridia bacterium]|nr:hypothetical protein [Clostridia bacterium]
MKKKILTASLLLFCAVALVATSVLTTVALLTSSAGVSNVFTVGDVKISMFESKVNSAGQPLDADGNLVSVTHKPAEKVDTNSYHLIPGETYVKDPTIYINSGEMDDMYLFVKSTNMIRSAEAGNYSDRTPGTTPKSMREQMHANGWVEFVRSGDGVEIVWVYGTRDSVSGKITPTPVNKATKQNADATAGEFRLCDSFTVYQHADVSLYGAASVTFTGFAIQKNGFTGDDKTGQDLTKAAWEAIKGSFPYNTGIVGPVNPYVAPTDTTTDAYAAVDGVENPYYVLLTPPTAQNP